MKRVWNKPKAGDPFPMWLGEMIEKLTYKGKKIYINRICVEFRYDD